MHHLKLLSTFLMLNLLLCSQVQSQGYPRLSSEAFAAATARQKAADDRSDAIFEKAKAIIDQGAQHGKPYIPWAAEPKDLPQAKIAAFPGAQGGGMYSFGGRGGTVFVVNNLNDDGPGSFREACESAGPRIVIFNVAGVVRLKDRIRIRAPYITIAGNTAPGDGVCIAGNTVELETHDVIIRHMRFRRGETDAGDRNDSIGGNPIGNIMIDHVSASWGLDENMSMYRHMYKSPEGGPDLKLPTVNITIQNSIFSEALNIYHHAFGSTIGGLNSTFVNNLWACNTGRNPSVGMYGDFTFANNVVFNYRHRTVDGGDHRSFYNIINNYFKPGPGTPHEAIAYRLLKPESERSKVVFDNFGKAYVAGNFVEGYPEVSEDNWKGGVQPSSRAPVEEVLPTIRSNEPFPHAKLNLVDAQRAYEHVLQSAGATLPIRDSVDTRIIETVRTGKVAQATVSKQSLVLAASVGYAQKYVDEIAEGVKVGFITDPSEVGGYPEYKGTPYQDSDRDGLPDNWELSNKLNPGDKSDAVIDSDGDGYTNVEEFINGTDPRESIANVSSGRSDTAANVATKTQAAIDGGNFPSWWTPTLPDEVQKDINAKAARLTGKLDLNDDTKSDEVVKIVSVHFGRVWAWHQQVDTQLNKAWSAWDAARDNTNGKTKDELGALIVMTEQIDPVYAQFAPQIRVFIQSLHEVIGESKCTELIDQITRSPGAKRTFDAYCEMVPELTDKEKEILWQRMVQAREDALAAWTDGQIVKIFKKYKIRNERSLDDFGYGYQKRYQEWVNSKK